MLPQPMRIDQFTVWLKLRRWIEDLSPDVCQLLDARAETMEKIRGNEHGLLQTGFEWYWDWWHQVGLLSDEEFTFIRKFRESRRCNSEGDLDHSG